MNVHTTPVAAWVIAGNLIGTTLSPLFADEIKIKTGENNTVRISFQIDGGNNGNSDTFMSELPIYAAGLQASDRDVFRASARALSRHESGLLPLISAFKGEKDEKDEPIFYYIASAKITLVNQGLIEVVINTPAWQSLPSEKKILAIEKLFDLNAKKWSQALVTESATLFSGQRTFIMMIYFRKL